MSAMHTDPELGWVNWVVTEYGICPVQGCKRSDGMGRVNLAVTEYGTWSSAGLQAFRWDGAGQLGSHRI